MKFKIIKNSKFAIRIEKGEEIASELKKFCEGNKIKGGFFFGIGAVDEIEIAHYNIETKKYSSQKILEPLEMVSFSGSVGVFEGDLVIHAHGIFSKIDMQTIGGHFVNGKVSGTAEIIFFSSEEEFEKIIDEETGLKVFKF